MVRAVWCVLRVYVARCILYVAWHMLHRRAYCSAFVVITTVLLQLWPKASDTATKTSTLCVAPGASTSRSGGVKQPIVNWSHAAQYRPVQLVLCTVLGPAA
jgi:hypothetical protein